jgi:exopolysaccharide production protein ExoQ
MLKTLEKAFVVFALMYFAGGLILALQPNDLPLSDEAPANSSMAMLRQQEKTSSYDPTGKNTIKLAVQAGIYLVTSVLILRNLREFLRLVCLHKLLLLLVALAVVSTFWSDVPGFTLRRSLVFVASSCFGIYLASRFTMREILRLVCIAGVIAALASLMVVWRKPDVGISAGVTAGDWQGIFGQKNTLGRFMSLQLFAFGMGAIVEKKWRWFYVAGSALCLPLIIMARDTTALLSLPVLMVLFPLFHLARKRSLVKMVAIISAVSATAAGFLFVVIIEPRKLLLLMGKDSTLSGRTEIWQMVWQKFLQHPWFGYGYSAFWMGKDGKESAGIWEALRWSVPHSHNGFLDVLVQLGVIGLGLFFVGYATFFRDALRCARASKSVLGLFPLMYMSFMILFNFSEGSIIREENLFWVLYVGLWVLTTRWLGLAEVAARRAAIALRRNTVLPVVAPAWRFESKPTTSL